MRGKEVCRTLKEIRAGIARQNDIPWETEECGFKGECRGTCPRCEATGPAGESVCPRCGKRGRAGKWEDKGASV